MKKNRYLLYLLLCGLMFYIAIPKLSFSVGGMESIYAGAWIFLAFLVFSGNLAAYLYTPQKRKMSKIIATETKRKRKSRVFTG